jgi:DNA-binding MarR family transcriptional regulator
MPVSARGEATIEMTTSRSTVQASLSRRPGDADRAIEELEHALFALARTILRFGIPPHALREGEYIDRAGYWMLTRLDESTVPMRMSDLAGLLELDLSTVSRQARQLVDGGLITRVADPVDRRACLVSLSARGHDVLEAVRGARHDALRRALSAWPDTETAALATSLARLAEDMQAPVRGSAK